MRKVKKASRKRSVTAKVTRMPKLPRVPKPRANKWATGMGIVNAGIGITVGLWHFAKLAMTRK